jgi:hypothetical protein
MNKITRETIGSLVIHPSKYAYQAKNSGGLASERKRLYFIYQFLAFLQPGHRVGGGFDILDDSACINDDRCGALDENSRLLKPVLVINISPGVCQHREWQMKALGVAFGLINRFPQNQHDLAIGSFEIVIQPPQLGGMAAALHSVKFAHEEQVYTALFAVTVQGDFTPNGSL